jgi:lysophospholipase L1-like esterase
MNSSVIQETAAVQKPAHELRKYVSWLFAVIITVLVAGAVLEVAGRYYIRLRTAQLPVIFGNANWGGLHEYDPDLLWKMLPNQKEYLCPYPVSTNSLGLRSKELRPVEGQFRILALGDSRTFGDAAGNEHTWPSLLEQQLNAWVPGNFEVINAGVGGYSAYQGMRFLEKYVRDLKPQLVIACFGTNEWGEVSPGAGGLVDWDDLTRRWGVEVLLREAVKGAAAIVEPSPFGPRRMRMSPGEFTDAYVRMRELSLQVGAGFSVMYLPSDQEVAQTPRIATIVESLTAGIAGYIGADFLNPKSMFPDHCEHLYADPIHFTPAGNQLIAGYIADTLFRQYQKQAS